MKYSIIIQPIRDEVTAKLIARNIASRSHESFTELISIVQNEEFTYAKNVEKSELEKHKLHLDEQGITYRIITNSEEPQPPKKSEETVPVKTKREPKIPAPKSSPISTTPSIEKPGRLKKVIPATVILLFVTAVFFIAFVKNSSKENRFSISEGVISKKGSSAAGSVPQAEPLRANPDSPEGKSRVYSDSADQKCGHAGHDAERLYRFAISYNQKNLDAWFGLLNCYRSINKESEAAGVEKEMMRIFGPAVLTPEEFTKEYGTKEALQIKERNVSYVFTTERKISDIYSDLFQIARRFNSSGKYNRVTVLAKRRDGSGIFMNLSLGNCITYRDFIENGSFEELK